MLGEAHSEVTIQQSFCASGMSIVRGEKLLMSMYLIRNSELKSTISCVFCLKKGTKVNLR